MTGVTEHRKNYPQQVLLVSFVRVTESVLVSLPTLPAGPLYRVTAARKVTDLKERRIEIVALKKSILEKSIEALSMSDSSE